MLTIRHLTLDDFPQMEKLMDSRKGVFSAAPTTDERHQQIKESTWNRLNWVFWCKYTGAFEDDGTLVAMAEVHRTDRPKDYVFGAIWTLKGHPLAKYKDTRFPEALVLIRQLQVKEHHELGFVRAWSSATDAPGHLRLVDVLMEEDQFVKTVYGTCAAGCISGDPFVDQFVFLNRAPPSGQVVVYYTDQNPLVWEEIVPEGGHPEPDPTKTWTGPHPKPKSGPISTDAPPEPGK